MAANRFFLSSRATCSVAPAFSTGWENTASAVRRSMKGYRSNYETITFPVTGTFSANDDVLVAQFISPPLSGSYSWTGADKARGIVRCLEDTIAADARAQVKIRLVKKDGTDYGSPKILIDFDASALASEFDATTLTNRKFPLAYPAGGTVVTPQSQVDGDRLVVEIGFRTHAGGTLTGSMRFGDGQNKGSDNAEDETSTTDNCAWMEFTTGTALATQDMGATGVSVVGGLTRISYGNWGTAGVNVTEVATSGGSPQFYVDATNGLDAGGNDGSIGAPWKTLGYAINTRLASGGANDRNNLGAFINLRTNTPHGREANPNTYTLGSSSIGSKNIGGSSSDYWTVRTYPGDSGKAIMSARTYYNTGMRFFRFENIVWDAATMTNAGGAIDCQGGRDVWHFDCEVSSTPQSLCQIIGDARATQQKASNVWFIRCKHHDGGTDVSGSPHHHCWYWGSNQGSGDADCDTTQGQGPSGGAISCIAYKPTGHGHQMFENAECVLVCNNTIDEPAKNSAISPGCGIEMGSTASRFSRSSKIVNSGFTNIDGGGGSKYGMRSGDFNGPFDGKNVAHHNGYFGIRTANEDSTQSNIWVYQGSNQTTDPLYTNQTGRNYQPLSSSPWKGTGDPAFAPGKDQTGANFVTTDIGAVAVASQAVVNTHKRRIPRSSLRPGEGIQPPAKDLSQGISSELKFPGPVPKRAPINPRKGK